ncbi:hypothetical protein T492DRAFT_989112 [Pavlovales sp. CCMP2436]|nr:hypothetical protein T492DRAFT_989112 [Pavlovales sp. CCMP2436]
MAILALQKALWRIKLFLSQPAAGIRSSALSDARSVKRGVKCATARRSAPSGAPLPTWSATARPGGALTRHPPSGAPLPTWSAAARPGGASTRHPEQRASRERGALLHEAVAGEERRVDRPRRHRGGAPPRGTPSGTPTRSLSLSL